MRRPEFLDFVTSAIHAADRPEIVRVETVLAAMADPTGLLVTTADGGVLPLRVLNVGGPPALPALPPSDPPATSPPRTTTECG